jgi:hypothetical protein
LCGPHTAWLKTSRGSAPPRSRAVTRRRLPAFRRHLRDHLTSEDAFSKEQNREINRDIDAVADSDSPPMEDEPFDRVQDWVIEWTHANPVPIPHRKVPDLEH